MTNVSKDRLKRIRRRFISCPVGLANTCGLSLLLVLSLSLVAPSLGRAADANQFLRPSDSGRILRVACVGDSITYGAGVENRDQNHYPQILGQCLGAKFETRNFGVSGATLLKMGDLPYWKQKAFEEVNRYEPDAVILKLGTNDSKPQNWKHQAQFGQDLKAMISHFLALPTKPKIWICLPAPVYQDRWGINEKIVKDEIIPIVRQVAQDLKIPIIDLHAGLSNRPEWFPDGVHPNAIGAANLAQIVCYSLLEHP